MCTENSRGLCAEEIVVAVSLCCRRAGQALVIIMTNFARLLLRFTGRQQIAGFVNFAK